MVSEELQHLRGFLSRIWLEVDYLKSHYQKYSGKLDGSTQAEIRNCFKTIDRTVKRATDSIDLALSQSKDATKEAGQSNP